MSEMRMSEKNTNTKKKQRLRHNISQIDFSNEKEEEHNKPLRCERLRWRVDRVCCAERAVAKKEMKKIHPARKTIF